MSCSREPTQRITSAWSHVSNRFISVKDTQCASRVHVRMILIDREHETVLVVKGRINEEKEN